MEDISDIAVVPVHVGLGSTEKMQGEIQCTCYIDFIPLSIYPNILLYKPHPTEVVSVCHPYAQYSVHISVRDVYT